MTKLEENDDVFDIDEYDDRQAYEVHLENIAKLAFIDYRAESVANEMATKFKDLDTDPISVFSISASMYVDSMSKKRSGRPLMSPEETGIPGVRRYLLELCAEANLKVYKNHAFEKMDNLLDRCRRITDVEKRHEGYKLLRPGFAKAVADTRDELSRIFNRFLEKDVAKVFVDGQKKKLRQTQLLKVVDEWAHGSKWNTYRACLVRKGIGRSMSVKYKTPENPTGAYNWNESQAEVINEDVDAWEKKMKSAVRTLAGHLKDAITSGCQDVQGRIRASSLPQKLRIEAIKEWEVCQKRVSNVPIRERFTRAVHVTYQFATTETDIRCMNAKVNAENYKNVYDAYLVNVQQKSKMRDLMSKRDWNNQLLIDRMERALLDKSKTDLIDAFNEFSAEAIKLMQAYDEHLSDHGPLEYVVTDADRQLRADVLRRIPELERKVQMVRAKFNDNMLLPRQAVSSTVQAERDEPARKKIKTEVVID